MGETTKSSSAREFAQSRVESITRALDEMGRERSHVYVVSVIGFSSSLKRNKQKTKLICSRERGERDEVRRGKRENWCIDWFHNYRLSYYCSEGDGCLRRSRKVEKHNVSKALPSHPSSSPSVEYYGPVAGSPCVWLILRQLIIIAFNLLHASSNESWPQERGNGH